MVLVSEAFKFPPENVVKTINSKVYTIKKRILTHRTHKIKIPFLLGFLLLTYQQAKTCSTMTVLAYCMTI
jgi:hypothetical protein